MKPNPNNPGLSGVNAPVPQKYAVLLNEEELRFMTIYVERMIHDYETEHMYTQDPVRRERVMSRVKFLYSILFRFEYADKAK